MKNYGGRGGCYPSRRQGPSQISIILHMIRKPNSIIVLSFIPNNSQFKTWQKHAYRTSIDPSISSSSSIVHVQVCPAPQIFSRQQMSPFELSSCFQLFFRLVLTLETSEMSAFLKFTSKTTQPRPKVFSVNGALTCRNAAFLTSFPR